MTTVYEFLGDEPIDNVITSMNFQVDKVVYFGYYTPIQKQKPVIEKFFKKHIHGTKCAFLPLSQRDLGSVYNTMYSEIVRERETGSDIFFDITGGEELILVAFGMLAREFDTPMHMFELPAGRLIELDKDGVPGISARVERREIKYTLDMHIELHGGVINYRLHKGAKSLSDPGFRKDILAIYDVYINYLDQWTNLAALLAANLNPGTGTAASVQVMKLSEATTRYEGMTVKLFGHIMDDLMEQGILTYAVRDGVYQVNYKSEQIKACLLEGGSILELGTLIKELEDCDDAGVGVHIDWDGEIHTSGGDVYNEVDVVSLRGYVPTFISCKSGKLIKKNNEGKVKDNGYHMALYELGIVAGRFGGRYAKMALVTRHNITGMFMERAEEMGIEVRRIAPQNS